MKTRMPFVVVAVLALTLGTACSKTTAKKRSGKAAPAMGATMDHSSPDPIEAPTHDCKSTPACQEAGHCTQEAGSCVVKRNADCEAASVCKRDGKCTAAKGQCVVGKAADCQQSKRCKHKGECKFENGECVAGKQ